jgi:hypothetical protein
MSLAPLPKKGDCAHCQYVKKYETASYLDKRQPDPYIHKDSLFIFQPVIDNLDEPMKYRYMNEFKMTYKDLHYCSDSTKLTLYVPGDSIKMWNIRPKISCKIEMWYRLSERGEELLSKYPVNSVKIENRVTDNIYVYKMSNQYYFMKIYDTLK